MVLAPTWASPAGRIIRRGWVVCLCAAACRIPGAPASAFAFVSPSVSRVDSCWCERAGRSVTDNHWNRPYSRGRSAALGAIWRPASSCSMSSDVSKVADVVRHQGRLPKSSFVVYTGPKNSPGKQRSPESQARAMEERVLGEKIQESVKLQKIKRQLSERMGAGKVTEEVWAQAAGKTVDVLRETIVSGDHARQTLVELNLGLVKGIVSGYVKSMANGSAVYFVKKDMVQEATVGLIKAVEKFDPTKGFRFATYAQWWVRKYLNECLQNQNRLVKIPVYLAHRVSRVSRASNELKLDLQRTPTPEELAEATGFTVDQVNTCLKQRSFSMTSLDSGGFGKAGSQNGAGPGSSSSGNLVDVTESNTELGKGTVSGDGGEMEAEEHLQRALRVDLGSALSRLLDSEERQCLVLRYGLEDGVPKTIEETARVMNIKNYDVQTISGNSMRKLRDGTLPEERAKLMSYLSVYEPETLRSANRVGRPGRWADVAPDHVDDDEDAYPSLESERLEEELARYLKLRGISKDFSPRSNDYYGALSAEELNLGSDRLIERRTPTKEMKQKEKASGGWSKAVLAKKTNGGVAIIGSSGVSKAAEEEEGTKVYSSVVGDAEPQPNSREADQLKHLSRLLFDGDDEPEDFVFRQSTLQ